MKKGQIVLFVIVLLTISLIIISSAVSRTLVGIKNNNINTDSTRAFNAAEAGIDELLKRSDLASLAAGAVQNTSSVDRSSFTEASYKIENSDPGYFGLISEDTVLQIEFNSNPTNLKLYIDSSACVLLSFYDTNSVVARRAICGTAVPVAKQINNYGSTDATACVISAFGTTVCTIINNFPATGQPAKMLLIKVLSDDSHIQLSATNYDTSFNTKPIKATAWATTKSGVKKEVQVITKTTNDIFPVFDNALYIR